MADGTGISWADATWPVSYGCDRVSIGCDNCYAIKTTNRLAHNPNPKVSGPAQGLVMRTSYGLDWTRRIALLPNNLGRPLRWRKPRRIFVNSQSDLFHEDVPTEYAARVFAVMAVCPQHVFQVLTKRHARLRSLLNNPEFRALVYDLAAEYDRGGVFDPYRYGPQQMIPHDYDRPAYPLDDSDWWPLRNVHVGVSVEDQHWADIRIPALLSTPAVVRWISAEPLRGPVDVGLYLADRYGLNSERSRGLDWVVAGGESGGNAHPVHPQWFRTLRDQCAEVGAAFQLKQWGEWGNVGIHTDRQKFVALDGTAYDPADVAYPDGPRYQEAIRAGHTALAAMYRVGRSKAGRELDGVVYDEFPTTRTGVSW